jgi:hypothetical protein
VLSTHSSTWCKPVLATIKNQSQYEQKIKWWDPSNPPKRKRFTKATFRKNAMAPTIRKKPGKGKGKTSKVQHQTNATQIAVVPSRAPAKGDHHNKDATARSKAAASDGGGSYPIVGAVSGTKKVVAVATTQTMKKRS